MDVNSGFRALIPITAGWSGDEKYCAIGKDGKKNFLRITPPEKAKRAENSFELQKKMWALGVPMCEPIECGETENGFYILQSWVDGENAEECVPAMSEDKQYSLGYESGIILKKIHSIPAPDDAPDWETRFNAKIDRKIRGYEECLIKLDGAEAFLEYLAQNRFLLRGRPQCFQHGDYHIGNMMIEHGKLVIIDFDRFDYGDPWEEFNRIVWCAQSAPRFAVGMVDGYFDGRVPMEFWHLLALYISSNTLSSIPWAIPFGEEEIRKFLEQAEEILGWYDGMSRIIPSWYSK
jgi:aminoglycoside phosphotransferase (APT) family kinase protein